MIPAISDYRIKFLSYYFTQGYRTLLDVSCGKGSFLRYFQWKGMDCCGTEIDDNLILEIGKIGIPCLKVDLNAKNLKINGFAQETFDVVTCTQVLEHIKHPCRAVHEMIKIAKHVVLITVPVGKSFLDPSHITFWACEEDIKTNLLRDVKCPYVIEEFVTKPEDYKLGQRCFLIAIFKGE